MSYLEGGGVFTVDEMRLGLVDDDLRNVLVLMSQRSLLSSVFLTMLLKVRTL